MKKFKRIVAFIYMVLFLFLLVYVLIYKTIPKRGLGVQNTAFYLLMFLLVINYILDFIINKEFLPRKVLIVLTGIFFVFIIIAIFQMGLDIDSLIGVLIFLPVVYIIIKGQILKKERDI